MSEIKCQECGIVHLAQFHCPEKIWRFLGLGDDDTLCAECTQRRAAERGVTLGWFVNDENYLNDPDWEPMDSLRAQLAQREGELEALRVRLREVLEELRAWMDDAKEGDFSAPDADDEAFYDRMLALSDNQEGR